MTDCLLDAPNAIGNHKKKQPISLLPNFNFLFKVKGNSNAGSSQGRMTEGEDKRMRFSALLFALSQILKWASKFSPTYRHYIGNIHLVRIMIKTADGRFGRVFIFDRGTVTSRNGAHHPYDAAIVWSDAATGFRVMASKSDAEQFKAAAEGKMKLDGMAFFAQWFNDGIKLIM